MPRTSGDPDDTQYHAAYIACMPRAGTADTAEAWVETCVTRARTALRDVVTCLSDSVGPPDVRLRRCGVVD